MLQTTSFFFLFSLFASSFHSLAQECDTTVYETVEEMPEFPGGLEKMYQFMADFTVPDVSQTHIQSKFYFEFIVQCDGSVTDLKALRNENHPITLAALDHLSNMPKWTPGKQHGQPVKVKYVVPLRICFLD